MKNGVKEFHLVAEPVVREFAPGMKANLWGYNGQSPGPTIEAVEGDRVRIFVTNKLPEPTSVHWHGILLPSGMDGVSGPDPAAHRPWARPSSTSSSLQRPGTLHVPPARRRDGADGDGDDGPVHRAPEGPAGSSRSTATSCFMLAAYDIEPGSATPQA